MVVALRGWVSGRYFEELFPDLYLYEVYHRIEFLTFFLAVPVFVSFISAMFPAEAGTFAPRLFRVGGALFSAFCLLAPAEVYGLTLGAYQAILLVSSAWVVVVVVRAIVHERTAVPWIVLGGFLVLAACSVNEAYSSTSPGSD